MCANLSRKYVSTCSGIGTSLLPSAFSRLDLPLPEAVQADDFSTHTSRVVLALVQKPRHWQEEQCGAAYRLGR